MAFKLIKVSTFVIPCAIQQVDESGKVHSGKLRVRFNKIMREQWEEMTNGPSDDDRLIYDVLVNKIEDKVEGDGGVDLSEEEAKAAIRADLSITGQIVDQGIESLFGAAAKNARRSRGR